MQHPVKAPKKLIEVALPLDAINVAATHEKSIRHGHPSTLHLWWARRPLAAARAVIFGQMVNDPSWKWEMEHPGEIPPGNLKASWAAVNAGPGVHHFSRCRHAPSALNGQFGHTYTSA